VQDPDPSPQRCRLRPALQRALCHALGTGALAALCAGPLALVAGAAVSQEAVLAGESAPAAEPALAAEPPALAFVHVNVVPMDSESVWPDQTVLVGHGRIARVGPAAEVALPDGVQRIDGRGEQYLMPGLCDSHMHVLDPDEFLLYLAKGVTTVRNMSGEPFHLVWRQRLAEGRMSGPTLVTTSPTLDGVPPEGSNRVIVTTRAEGERAVEQSAADGYELIKVYGGLLEEAYAGIIAAARRTGLKVVGHLPRAVGFEGALAAGQASIDHAEEFLGTVFRNAGVDELPDAVRRTREAGTWVTPTLVTFERIGAQIADAEALARRPELRFADPAARRRWLTTDNRYLRDFAPEDAARFREQLRFLRLLVRRLHEAGVPLLAGTDAGVAFGVPFVLPGWSLHEELSELVGCGLSPYEALATATANPARFMQQEGEVGVVRAGARADLLLLDGNPLEDVAHAAQPVGVMVRGRWLPAAELASQLAALETLYRDEEGFLQLLREEGVAPAVERFREARQRDPHARLFRESALNEVGYALLDADRTDDALAAFALNVEAYPESAEVYDSLGEACLQAGDTERAIANYERSLALDPGNTNAREVLAGLR